MPYHTADAGVQVEQGVRTALWGKIAVLADPFGHGLCLIQFLNRGYDELACGARTKGTYLRDKFHRLRARMGTKKAAVAVAHKILVAAFHMLQRAVAFAELGAGYLDHVDKHRTAKRLVRRLDALGYAVLLSNKPAG